MGALQTFISSSSGNVCRQYRDEHFAERIVYKAPLELSSTHNAAVLQLFVFILIARGALFMEQEEFRMFVYSPRLNVCCRIRWALDQTELRERVGGINTAQRIREHFHSCKTAGDAHHNR